MLAVILPFSRNLNETLDVVLTTVVASMLVLLTVTSGIACSSLASTTLALARCRKLFVPAYNN